MTYLPFLSMYKDLFELKDCVYICISRNLTFFFVKLIFLLCRSVVIQSLVTMQKMGQEERLGNIKLEPY